VVLGVQIIHWDAQVKAKTRSDAWKAARADRRLGGREVGEVGGMTRRDEEERRREGEEERGRRRQSKGWV
jgi:hypothetical protein